MNDLPGFRPPARVPIPPGALDRVVATGVRRRRRAAATGGGVVCASLIVLAAFTGGTAGTTSLRPVHSSVPTTAPAGPTAPPSRGSRPGTGPLPADRVAMLTPTPLPPDGAPPIPDVSPVPEPSPRDRAWVLSHQRMRSGHARYGDLTYGTRTWGDCRPPDPSPLPDVLASPEPAPPWCFEVSFVDAVDHAATPEQPVTIRLALCRTGEDGDTHTVTWPSWQRGEISIGHPELWTWSTGFTFDQQRATTRFRSGDCATWTTTWNGTDNDGYRVPDGTYLLSAWPTGGDDAGSLDRYAVTDGAISAG